MTDQELIKTFDGYVERTKFAFEETGFAPHHFMVVRPNGDMGICLVDTMPIPKDIPEHIAKDFVASFITSACQKYDAIAVIHITEAWAHQTTATDPDKAEAELQEVMESGPIRDRPDRIECLMLTLETKSMNKSVTFPIIRLNDDDPKPKLGKPIFELTSGDKAQLGGRFTGLLPCNTSGITETWDKPTNDEQSSWGGRFGS